jgi:hypothetical protein
MIPLYPGPPNNPKVFCAPWAKKIAPNTTLRTKRCTSLLVVKIFLNIVLPPETLLASALDIAVAHKAQTLSDC